MLILCKPWYAGEYLDLSSGMYYLRARYYQPMTGRFLTEDPIKDGLNWYIYCENNPIIFVDPLGLAEYQLGGLSKAPEFQHDHGFEYDSNAKANIKDYLDFAYWNVLGWGADTFVGNLHEAANQYAHYLDNTGTDRGIIYRLAYEQDSVIKSYIDNEIYLMQQFAQSAFADGAGSAFEIIGGIQGIPNGDSENWQKAIGAHQVYGYGETIIDYETGMATMKITFTMEDMYNFNPGMADIATGIPDSANGRFSVLGWAKEFKTYGSLNASISWNVNDLTKEPMVKVGNQR